MFAARTVMGEILKRMYGGMMGRLQASRQDYREAKIRGSIQSAMLNSRAILVQPGVTSPRQVEDVLVASSRAPIWNPRPYATIGHCPKKAENG
ncbi:hypothetical protein [Mesorhizobium sp. L2C084A000]|uniref:hypothetical protein n=1 Tax=Mesorhizobium sp. L2C084A000 TaxID=1287116 RepID=UPI0012DD7BC8|nr:hypothetical protein [Mesorhizobium sp. L2C084A000]